jgi:hypothetical protein
MTNTAMIVVRMEYDDPLHSMPDVPESPLSRLKNKIGFVPTSRRGEGEMTLKFYTRRAP